MSLARVLPARVSRPWAGGAATPAGTLVATGSVPGSLRAPCGNYSSTIQSPCYNYPDVFG